MNYVFYYPCKNGYMVSVVSKEIIYRKCDKCKANCDGSEKIKINLVGTSDFWGNYLVLIDEQ